nr:helix-turn-helix transcriptional regulator [uncultured Blautia sp.]
MLANFEKRENTDKSSVWAGSYQNLHNLPHWHLECELIYVQTGEVTVSHNNTAYHLQKEDCIFINSGEIHYIKGSEDSITDILMFDTALLGNISPKHFQLLYPRLRHHYPVMEYFHAIRDELKKKKEFYDVKVSCLMTDFIIDIFRHEPLCEQKQLKDSSSIENYKNLLSEIEEKCSYITFEDACVFMGLSKPYFSRFFKNLSGMTFSQYLNIIRLEKAIQLLNHNTENLSITQIASSCGFDTIRHFNRVFKDFTGLSPRQLPENYVLSSHSIRSMKKNFNPTLPCSVLVEDFL